MLALELDLRSRLLFVVEYEGMTYLSMLWNALKILFRYLIVSRFIYFYINTIDAC